MSGKEVSNSNPGGVAVAPLVAQPAAPGSPDPLFAPLEPIEDAIRDHLAKDAFERPQALAEAMRYSALGGGKRLRPLLAWHACAAAGGKGPDSLAAGIAIELVHAFSLVHDDLPALDNDDLRRGRPTLHRHAGEAMAILAGDQLLVEAFVCISQVGDLTSDQRTQLCHELADATSRMVSGQVYDTLGGLPPHWTPEEKLRLIHRNKTGALITAACRMGAMSVRGGVDPSRLRALTEYGQRVGLMFQVVDDLLDVTQTSEHLGKRSGKDIQAGKMTYPGVLGVDRSREDVMTLRDQAIAAIERLGAPAQPLVSLCIQMSDRTK